MSSYKVEFLTSKDEDWLASLEKYLNDNFTTQEQMESRFPLLAAEWAEQNGLTMEETPGGTLSFSDVPLRRLSTKKRADFDPGALRQMFKERGLQFMVNESEDAAASFRILDPDPDAMDQITQELQQQYPDYEFGVDTDGNGMGSLNVSPKPQAVMPNMQGINVSGEGLGLAGGGEQGGAGAAATSQPAQAQAPTGAVFADRRKTAQADRDDLFEDDGETSTIGYSAAYRAAHQHPTATPHVVRSTRHLAGDLPEHVRQSAFRRKADEMQAVDSMGNPLKRGDQVHFTREWHQRSNVYEQVHAVITGVGPDKLSGGPVITVLLTTGPSGAWPDETPYEEIIISVLGRDLIRSDRRHLEHASLRRKADDGNLRNYPDISSYEEAEQILGGKEEKKIAHNTVLHRVGNGIAVQYHQTDIVTYNPNGDITLNSAVPYRYATTLERLHLFAPCRVWQKNFEWFVEYRGKTYEFMDNMTLRTGGGVDGAPEVGEGR